ncbi:MAG: ribonuclease III [Proteobacteria bacterium]|nr:ribonuclease III [Alphaproteobacteria bacterium]NCC03075.1 ribonuclease III [Pseudomonadota bacterium]
MPIRRHNNLDPLMGLLGHRFADDRLLKQALTHPSFTTAKRHKAGKISPYERLEFLGDRVLGLVIAHWLYDLYPDVAEGELAKRHASLVNRDALKETALKLGLEPYLVLAQGEEVNVDRKNLAVLSDATEGIIGAMYLDGGLAPAERFIKKYWDQMIRIDAMPSDPKTTLQEFAQSKRLPLPTYNEIERSGPAHEPHFVIEVMMQGYPPQQGEGTSKRLAEKAAATRLLEKVTKV